MARFNHPRLQREAKTVEHMIGLYCSAHHAEDPYVLPVGNCWTARTLQCPFGQDKPACNHCRIHCYPQGYRERIRVVMRYAGPQLVWHHPILAIRHWWDAWNERDDS